MNQNIEENTQLKNDIQNLQLKITLRDIVNDSEIKMTNEENEMLPDESTNVSTQLPLNTTPIKITIPIGFYPDIPSILNMMMKKINENLRKDKLIYLDYKEHTNRVVLSLPPKYSLVWSTKNNPFYLGEMLGFKDSEISSSCTATYEPDLMAGKDLLFIYCSIIEPQIVGNYKTRLLNIIPVNVKRNEYIYLRYDTPRYVPVNQDIIDHVLIEIRDSAGELINFEAGKVMLKLHFINNNF
jgi:hypothetical protein